MKIKMGSAELAARAAEVGLGWTSPLYRPDTVEGFKFLGVGSSRVALLGPDGVVYKAPTPALAHEPTFELERHLFLAMDQAGDQWCPDFWPYDAHRVMAMRHYTVCDTETFRRSEEAQAVTRLIADVGPGNVGVDDDGSFVLLDGNLGFDYVTVPKANLFARLPGPPRDEGAPPPQRRRTPAPVAASRKPDPIRVVQREMPGIGELVVKRYNNFEGRAYTSTQEARDVVLLLNEALKEAGHDPVVTGYYPQPEGALSRAEHVLVGYVGGRPVASLCVKALPGQGWRLTQSYVVRSERWKRLDREMVVVAEEALGRRLEVVRDDGLAMLF